MTASKAHDSCNGGPATNATEAPVGATSGHHRPTSAHAARRRRVRFAVPAPRSGGRELVIAPTRACEHSTTARDALTRGVAAQPHPLRSAHRTRSYVRRDVSSAAPQALVVTIAIPSPQQWRASLRRSRALVAAIASSRCDRHELLTQRSRALAAAIASPRCHRSRAVDRVVGCQWSVVCEASSDITDNRQPPTIFL